MPPEDAVSGATETTGEQPVESSSTETQATTPDTQPTSPDTKEKIDWRKAHREDPDANAYIQSQIAKAKSRWERQQLKQAAKAAVDAEDADTAFGIAKRVASEPDEVDEDEARDIEWTKRADKVQPYLTRLLRLDANNRATSEYYARLVKDVGADKMNKHYADDPEGFVEWLDDQITEMRVEDKVKKVAPVVAKGMAEDAAHLALAGEATPLTGGSGAGGQLTLERYNNDPDLRKQLRSTAEGRAKIDAMIARSAR